MNARRFDDKVAVVTGGTTGIGRATVERLHDEGAAVVFCGRRSELGHEVAASLDPERALFVTTDVTSRERVESLYERAVDRFGRLDVVVNNAGNIVVSPTLSLRPEHWRHTMALNLDAVFHSCQIAIPHLQVGIASGRTRQAAIVDVASPPTTLRRPEC